ncbi:MAG: nucleotidyl transferase AbiEii/AbiGii toxin family protein [Bacteroidales bacterium]|nr:nucleotidyl transferase AbiEii/AbiGii toxin family protein [Bacteroidales bacterium]
MIDPSSYSTEWISTVSARYRNTDKILIEKVIRALTLLKDLKLSGLNFIFKGGTALMLMLDKPYRLSIDIDIIMDKSHSDLNTVFENICKKGTFNHFVSQERHTENAIEKAHYKFYYNPVIRTHSEEEYVILDILFESNPYNKLIQTPIQSPFIKLSGEPNTVTTPIFEAILGDKLTAFAPNTTGVPYFKGKTSMSMEIIKQLYDIGNLFDVVSDIIEIKDAFETIAINELKYREMEHLQPVDILKDIIQTSFCISTRGISGDCRFADIQHGIKRISSFIYSNRYVIEDAILSASKAAYLAALLNNPDQTIVRFSTSPSFSELSITNPTYNKLNKLKKGIPEAFWNWYHTVQLLTNEWPGAS